MTYKDMFVGQVLSVDGTKTTLVTQPWLKDAISFFLLLILQNKLNKHGVGKSFSAKQFFALMEQSYTDLAMELQLGMSPENLFKVGFRWYNEMDKLKNKLVNSAFYASLGWSSTFGVVKTGKWEISEITHGKALVNEGLRMQNCAYLYHRRIIQDAYAILHASMSEEEVTIECQRLNNNLFPLQIKAIGNRDYSFDSEEETLIDIITSRNLDGCVRSLATKFTDDQYWELEDYTLCDGLDQDVDFWNKKLKFNFNSESIIKLSDKIFDIYERTVIRQI